MSNETKTSPKPFLSLILPPFDVEIDGCTVTVLEVAKLSLPWEEFQASCQLKYKNIVSRIFQVSYKNSEELKQKLKTEIAKFKFALMSMGVEEMRKRGLIL
jgi:hypothetical protein